MANRHEHDTPRRADRPGIPLTLHVGMHKTGSTLIQSSLAANADRLAAQGLLYPRTYRDVLYGHHALAYGLGVGHPQLRAGWDRDRLSPPGQMIEEMRRNGCERILLSTEVYGRYLPVETYRELRDFLSDFDITGLVYLRRQDYYLSSLYAEQVKTVFSARDIASLLNNPRTIDYWGMLENLAVVFGRDRIVVRPFEKAQMPDGPFADLMQAVGCEMDDTYAPPDDEAANVSFAPEVTELLRYFNRRLSGKRKHWAVRKTLMRRPDARRKSPFGDISLPPDLQLEVLQAVRDGNARIARDYLHRPDGVLFRDPEPGPDAERTYHLADVRAVLNSAVLDYLLGKRGLGRLGRCIAFFMEHVAYCPIAVQAWPARPPEDGALRLEADPAPCPAEPVRAFLELKAADGPQGEAAPRVAETGPAGRTDWPPRANHDGTLLYERPEKTAGAVEELQIQDLPPRRWQARLIRLYPAG
ncbi:MAG: hypothetical protein KGY81_05030 [Phycisphaerae bacterium]|nr:hypothetical protein [Phycisphaerae bacterium]